MRRIRNAVALSERGPVGAVRIPRRFPDGGGCCAGAVELLAAGAENWTCDCGCDCDCECDCDCCGWAEGWACCARDLEAPEAPDSAGRLDEARGGMERGVGAREGAGWAGVAVAIVGIPGQG